MVELEILQLLGGELADANTEMQGCFNTLTNQSASDSDKSDALEKIQTFIERLSDAAAIVEFTELVDLCVFFSANCMALTEGIINESTPEHVADKLVDWLKKLQYCFERPEDVELIGALFVNAQDPELPMPMAQEDAEELADKIFLQFDQIGSIDESGASLRSEEYVIDESAMSLSFADDVNPRLIDVFFTEVPDQVEKLSALMQAMSSDKVDIELLRSSQRIAHTIKGSANIVGLGSVATLTHMIEDVFDALVDEKCDPSEPLGELLVDSTDHLEAILDYVSDRGPAPENTYQVLENLGQWYQLVGRATDEDILDSDDSLDDSINIDETIYSIPDIEESIDCDPSAEIESPEVAHKESHIPSNEAVVDESTMASSSVKPSFNKANTPSQDQSKNEESKPQQQPELMVRVAAKSMNTMTGLAGELSTSLVQIETVLNGTRSKAHLIAKQNSLVNQRLAALQDLIELKSIPVQRLSESREINEGDFDSLEMDEYNELHSVANALAESLTDVKEFTETLLNSIDSLQSMRDQQDRLSTELNDTLMSTRLAPIETIVARLQRGVRQASKATGKQASLTMTGTEMLVDNQILDTMVDPLSHLLRNAVDHGLEASGDRSPQKPKIGQLSLAFNRRGESLEIECSDDGYGFDIERIKAKAIAAGMLENEEEYTDNDWLNLTLLAGFSTRDQISQVSGRGIGMDVVRKAIENLRGTINISSEYGKGSKITLRVPLTLISMHLLLVKVENSIFATPSSGIEQALFSDAGVIERQEGENRFLFSGEVYKLLYLNQLLGLTSEFKPNLEKPTQLLLMNTGNELVAIQIEAALDGRSLVVNRFNDYIPRLPGSIGATILGDGSIAPVLDLVDLIQRPVDSFQARSRTPIQLKPAKALKALVVDDSISARRSLVDCLKNSGMETFSAVDGLDAINVLEKENLDIVLLDLEMPRMNGIELTKHLRSKAEYENLPIIMITSRSTAKHKNLATKAGVDGFVTKPFQDDSVTAKVFELIDARSKSQG